MAIKPPFYPIIYARGFAASQGAIENASATPYMGFNLGATKLRQNHKGEILRFIFESPLLRLMKDHGYEDTYADGDLVTGRSVSPKSVWIFRYYEKASEPLGTGERQPIPEIAKDLRAFILKVRDSVAGDDAQAKKDFRVYLVAHSMGGLVCRCYLQNICTFGTGDPALDAELELSANPDRDAEGFLKDEVHLVDKVFTYATPHNGIEMLGVNVPDLGSLDAFHTRNFNRKLMHEYLGLLGDYQKGQRVDSLETAFRARRFFCLVGTNFHDYHAFAKLSRLGTGEMSDGLVMIRNAAVRGAPRAFAHRAHSGHFGIVNSEEGYQNLRRFLFGNVKVDAKLAVDTLDFPKKVQEAADAGKEVSASYHIEATAAVRQGIPYLHERKFDQASAILKTRDDLLSGKEVFLFSGYLLKSERPKNAGDRAMAFAVQIGIRSPMYEIERKLWFDTHFEGVDIFRETLTFKIRDTQGELSVKYGLGAVDEVAEANRNPTAFVDPDGRLRIEVPLKRRGGFEGRFILETERWNV